MTEAVDLSKALPITIFFAGIFTATFAGSGLFFLKYWKKTEERFFLFFGLACWILAFERVFFLWLNPSQEPSSWLYLLRLGAFALIMRAVVSANQARKKS